jgi:hypothetical protein
VDPWGDVESLLKARQRPWRADAHRHGATIRQDAVPRLSSSDFAGNCVLVCQVSRKLRMVVNERLLVARDVNNHDWYSLLPKAGERDLLFGG